MQTKPVLVTGVTGKTGSRRTLQTGDGHAGEVYEVTRPRLLTFGEFGRPPKDFSDFAREVASTGLWGNAA